MNINFIKKLTISLIVLMGLNSQAQTTHSTTASAKATVTLAAVCTISSQNVNFGQLLLPINAQSATSSMSVQCTKGSSYTIGLAYGGVYGSGNSSAGDYWKHTGNITQSCNGGTVINVWTEYNASGSAINTAQVCPGASGSASTATVEQALNATYSNGTFTANSTAYNYGILSGMAKGDTIAYAIQVPNNPSEVWNSGNYTYTATGSGSNQSIPVVATLVPGKTTDQYPVADTYLDTVTATINY